MRAWQLFGRCLAIRFMALAAVALPPLCTQAQTTARPLEPFASPGTRQVAPAWQFENLPKPYEKPATRFDIVTERNLPALRIATDNSYGLLVQTWQGPAPYALKWRWRLDRMLSGADIATRAGDDSALKVCVIFDEPLAQVPLIERTALRMARAAAGRPLPAATLCYLWDGKYAPESAGRSVFTSRVRHIVLRGPEAPLEQWLDEQRNVAADFQKLFGDECPQTPAVIAVAVGADSDNTHSASIGWIADLRWGQ